MVTYVKNIMEKKGRYYYAICHSAYFACGIAVCFYLTNCYRGAIACRERYYRNFGFRGFHEEHPVMYISCDVS